MTSDREAHEFPRFADLDSEYEIVRELGRGGTAVVYLAHERELGRRVAIKVIRTTFLEDDEAVARLEREARTVASLQHPNIVTLYGTRRLRDNSLALIMQYMPGRTLKSEVRTCGPLPFDRVERILTDLGRGLSCAQRHRIVHRDIKPENIYTDDETGSARLSDFGTARAWDVEQGLTLPGMALGTPAYMSPEQIDGRELDGRSDLYSLGMVGYEMLTGQQPWPGESLFGLIYKQKHESLPELETLRPAIPGRLRHALDGLLRKDREERWRDADEFLTVLRGEVGVPKRWRATQPKRDSAIVPAIEPFVDTVKFRRDDPKIVPETSAETGSDSGQPAQLNLRADAPTVPAQGAADARQDSEPAAPDPALIAEIAKLVADEPARLQPAPQTGPRRLATVVGAIVLLILVSAVMVLVVDARDRADETVVEIPPVALSPEPARAGAQTVTATRSRLLLIRAVHGNDQHGLVGDTLGQPLVLRVEDEAGQPVAGIAVRFEITAGDSRVQPELAVTDTTGAVRTRWFLRAPGVHTLTAKVPELTSYTTYRAEALPKPRARIAADPPVEIAETPVAPRLPTRSGVSVGGTHTCALKADGGAVCWGSNNRGQLGGGSGSPHDGAVAVAGPEPFASLSAGVSHTCGVGVSGIAYCWGSNSAGQLGDGTLVDRAQPTRLVSAARLVRVFAGVSHSCGLEAGGQLYCWGRNSNGQLGDGTHTDRTEPVRVASAHTFRSVGLGWAHTCALTLEGAALCWGRNEAGELGDGTTADRSTPEPVKGGSRFTSIAAGSRHTCGLLVSGLVSCWGQNSYGQLGNNATMDSTVPVVVQSTDSFAAVAVGGVHSCALTREGSALCWGRNTYGQLGDGTVQDRLQPTPVASSHRFNALFASGAHTCGVVGSAPVCWGYNVDGQLGDGTRVNQTRPVTVIHR